MSSLVDEVIVRRLSRRDFLRLSAMAAAGVALAGCRQAPATEAVMTGAEPVADPPTAAPAQLVWMSGDLEVLEQLDPFYEENPEITVEIIEDEATRFRAMLAAGEPPDMWYTSGRQIPHSVKRGILLEIDAFIEADDVITEDNLLPVHSWMQYDGMKIGQGKTYGLIKDWSPDYSGWVDPLIFEEAGVPVPSEIESLKYSDLPAIAEQLVEREGDRTLRFGISGVPGYQLERVCQTAALEARTQLYDEYYSRITLTDNQAVMDALQMVYDMQKQRIMPSPLDPAGGWQAQLWSQGKFGILGWTGYWFSGLVRMWAAEDEAAQGLMERCIMTPAFAWGSKPYNGSVGPTCTALTKKTKAPEAAWKLLKYYSGGLLAEERAKSGWGLPTLESLMPLLPDATPFDQRINAGIEEALKHADWIPQVNPYYNSDSFGEIFIAEVDRSLNGEQAFEDAVSNVQDQVNQLISEGVAAAS
jgi:multiple sugar transport system substrate-binding protein